MAWTPPPPLSPRDEALDLVDDAYQSSARKGIRFARQALELWPDCTEALIYLATHDARGPAESLALYEQAVAAGPRNLDPIDARNFDGVLYSAPSAQPYMHALAGRIHTLSTLGRYDDVAHRAAELLAMDPTDPCRIQRFVLDALLRTNGEADASDTILYGRPTFLSDWNYNIALLRFRREGDTRFARRKRDGALAMNDLAASYITGAKAMPRRGHKPTDVTAKGLAIDYAVASATLWHETPGAVEWLSAGNAVYPTNVGETDPRSDGPCFLLSLLVDYSVCPACEENTDPSASTLAVVIEPHHALATRVKHESCPVCGMIIVEQ